MENVCRAEMMAMRAGAALIFCIYMKRENINKKSSYTIRAATTPYKNVSIPRELTLHSKRAPAKKKTNKFQNFDGFQREPQKNVMMLLHRILYIQKNICVVAAMCHTHKHPNGKCNIFISIHIHIKYFIA